jgi:hypothetical protein
MNRIFGTALFIALLGCAWNILALIVHLIFGVNLPGVDAGNF